MKVIVSIIAFVFWSSTYLFTFGLWDLLFLFLTKGVGWVWDIEIIISSIIHYLICWIIIYVVVRKKWRENLPIKTCASKI